MVELVTMRMVMEIVLMLIGEIEVEVVVEEVVGAVLDVAPVLHAVVEVFIEVLQVLIPLNPLQMKATRAATKITRFKETRTMWNLHTESTMEVKVYVMHHA